MVAPSLLEQHDSLPGSSTPPRRGGPAWTRPAILALGLFSILSCLGLLTSPDGYLSTDTGGKTATLVALDRNGGLDVDLGYWAESVDPDGSLYPMYSTQRFEDGGWVNVTSFPMLLAARPLYELGGMRAALILPIVGSVLTALAAGALARRLCVAGAARRTSSADLVAEAGAVATIAVGLAGPAAIYALDFWEHSLGLGLMGWAMVWLHDALENEGHLSTVVASGSSGLAFGAAATMRQEALVFGFAAGCTLLVVGFLRRGVASLVQAGTMAAAALVPLTANAALESSILGSAARAERGLGTAAAAGSELQLRVEEAFVTGFGASGRVDLIGIVAPLLLGWGLFGLVAADAERRRRAGVIAAVATLPLMLDLAVNGLRFVPGLLFATPLAALGLAAARRGAGPLRIQVATVVAATPLVWAVQFTGGAGPQWAGRYILLTGFVLSVAGIARFWGSSPSAVIGVACLGLVVTTAGVAWTVQRSHAFAQFSADLAAAPESALVFSDPFVSREAGPVVLDERWLAAWTDDLRSEAAVALTELGIDEFGYVQRGHEPEVEFEGFGTVGERTVELFDGYEFRITTYVSK